MFVASSVLFVLYVLAVFLVAIECWKIYLNRTKLKAYAHSKGYLVVGNLLKFLKCDNEQIFDFPNQLMKNLVGPVFYTWMAHVLFIYTDSPAIYQQILNSDKTLKKAYLYSFLRNRTGIFTSVPSVWKTHRKALNPTLGPKMVGTFLLIFNEKFHKMVKLMERDIGNSIDMHRIMFKAAIDSIFSASFDIDWPMQNKRGDELRDAILAVMERVQLRFHSVLMKWEPIYRLTEHYEMDSMDYPKINRMIQGIIEAKRNSLAEKLVQDCDELATAKETNSFNYIQKCLQLELEQKFDNENTREEMETILVGGVDTSAITISGITLMLAIHQDYQDRVVEELRSIFSSVDDPVTSDHLPMMSFMELVIKESLRHFPIAPYLARECTEDFPLNGGTVPKGAQIVMNIYKTNRNPEYWGENAHEFYPERFLPENSADYHPYQFIPFSAGPRNCIGMRYAWASLKIALAYLLRHYKFTTDLKMQDVRIKTGLIMKIANKNPVRIERSHW